MNITKASIATKVSIALNVVLIALLVNTYLSTPKSTLHSISKKAFLETFGSPHIVEGNYVYYLGSWGPGATLHKFRFDGDMMIESASQYYEEEELYPYISKLIESLRSDDQGRVYRARRFLEGVMTMQWPNGYGAGYMKGEGYKGLPFERGKYPHAGYEEWKQWWEREGKDSFNYPHRNFLETIIYHLQTLVARVVGNPIFSQ